MHRTLCPWPGPVLLMVTWLGCPAQEQDPPATWPPPAHREVAAACPKRDYTSRPDGGVPLSGECEYDSDCTKFSGGRCTIEERWGYKWDHYCGYDVCFSDSDCPPSAVCVCGQYNYCVASTCRVDSDCGPGNFCSPSQNCSGSTSTYACHSPSDVCTTHSDCDHKAVCGPNKCRYDQSKSEWICQQTSCLHEPPWCR